MKFRSMGFKSCGSGQLIYLNPWLVGDVEVIPSRVDGLIPYGWMFERE